ncbi:MAG: CsoS2 family carboxysome shell protein [Geminicoccaceae bacterium]|nr:CsoS2 family carboxysome shell protein [Geminicoccaceae bacterium]
MNGAATALVGRAASLARRRALAQGKRALPPPSERVRSGFRDASLPAVDGAPATTPRSSSSPAPTADPPSRTLAARGATVAVGRDASLLRRRLLARGKAALGFGSSASLGADRPAAPANAPSLARGDASSSCPPGDLSPSCRALVRARRAERSRYGQGGAVAVANGGAATLVYPPKVVAVTTEGGQRVTGIRIGHSARVTGVEAGLAKPITGTPYIGPEEGATTGSAAPKVGLARTEGGLVVSGTLVRSRVPITGDEAGERIRITGEVDPRPSDDLTPRRETAGLALAQFQRQANPHGHSVFGTNLGRSARWVGSRARDRGRPIEVTVGGQPITGTAVGRSPRVTGDEPGSCRALTGTQYLAPARAVLACDPDADAAGSERPDPVTGGKVREALTWRGQRVTGPEFEQEDLVTGTEAGTCSPVTGTPYQGVGSVVRWCTPQAGHALAQRILRNGRVRITGDVPLGDLERVSGLERGADRPVTGTPYYEVPALPAPAGENPPVATEGFSVLSPQRRALLEAEARAARRPKITGSFSLGEGKVTGHVDFGFRPRLVLSSNPGHRETERPRVTGEGGTRGARITGDAWRDDPRVTGTEGTSAAARNPSERGGERKPFAHSSVFKGKGKDEPPRKLVTGVIGWTPKSAAVVTLSGGAQG